MGSEELEAPFLVSASHNVNIRGSCEQIHIICIQVRLESDQQKETLCVYFFDSEKNDQFSRKIFRIRSVEKPHFPLATNISY